MIKQYFISVFLSMGFVAAIVVFAFLMYHGCGGNDKPTTTETTVKHDTTLLVIVDTLFAGEGKGKTKFTYGGMVHDTTIERIYITTENNDTVSSFTSVLDTVQNGDTLHIEYRFPSAMFSYYLRTQPDSIKVVNTTTEIVRFESVAWYEKPLFVSGVTAAVLVALSRVVK